MADHLYTYADPPNPRHLQQISDLLRNHGVVAIPTGTSWAFCADPTSKKANNRIRLLKPDRPKEQPFSLLCRDISMATSMTTIDGSAFRTLNRIWPGPFTVLLRSNRQLPRLLKTKREVVGVRVPASPLAMAIVDHFGGPLMVSTVPRDSEGQHLRMGYQVFESYGHGLDLVVDLGDELSGAETTVVDMTSGAIEVIRAGVGDPSLL